MCVVLPRVSAASERLRLAVQFSHLLSHCNCLLRRLGSGSWLWDVGNAQTSALWDRKRKWGLNSAQAAHSAVQTHIVSPQPLVFTRWRDSEEAAVHVCAGYWWDLGTISPPSKPIWSCLHTLNPQITGSWLLMARAKTSLSPSRRLWSLSLTWEETHSHSRSVWMCLVLSAAFAPLPCPHDDIDWSEAIGRFS